MEGRVEEPHGHRQPVHRLKQIEEVLPLHLTEVLERPVKPIVVTLVHGEEHLAHHGQPFLEEHVLGAGEADALGTEPPSRGRVGTGVGVRPHLEATEVVGPVEDLGQRPAGLGLDHRHLAQRHPARGAVDRDHVARLDRGPVHLEPAGSHVDAKVRCTDDRGLPHSPSHDGGMAHQPTPAREDAFGGDHPVDVVG